MPGYEVYLLDKLAWDRGKCVMYSYRSLLKILDPKPAENLSRCNLYFSFTVSYPNSSQLYSLPARFL